MPRPSEGLKHQLAPWLTHGSPPEWYQQSPAQLRAADFVFEQAMRHHPHRAAKIRRSRASLPHPAELFCVAEPYAHTGVHPSQRWDVFRRMGGWALTDAPSVDKADLSRWVHNPGGSPILGAALVGDVCASLGAPIKWVRDADQSQSPPWLKPWVEWDLESRRRGLRTTDDQGTAEDARLSQMLESHFGAKYASWKRQFLAAWAQRPQMQAVALPSPERERFLAMETAIERWRSNKPKRQR